MVLTDPTAQALFWPPLKMTVKIYSNGNRRQWYEFRLEFHRSFFSRIQLTILPALAQIMAWRWPGDNPFLNQWRLMLVILLTQICVIRPKWIKAGLIDRFLRDVSFFVVIMLPVTSQIKIIRGRNLSRYLWITVGKFVQDNVIIKTNDTVSLLSHIWLSCSLWITMTLTLPTS